AAAVGAACDFVIFTGDTRRAPDEGLALTLSPHRVNSLSPLVGLKTINYLEPLLSWEEARARDFDEAVRLNERGELVSAALANLFWVTEGRLHTPALTTGALAGTTRDLVLELAEELFVPRVEGVFELSHLAEAEEIFLTSSGLGVAPVRMFDFRGYAVSQFNVAARLGDALEERARAGPEI
ncbi:MAG: aminotransferase class IV, partial [Pyrinomonadaceae bacterium]